MANFFSELPKYGLLGMLTAKSRKEKEEEERRKRALTGQQPTAMKCGGKVKKFSKGGSMDDLTPRSNLPKKYAKGGSVRGDGCCVKGKTKGHMR